MSYNEVKVLRQSGNLREAFDMAMQDLQRQPTDIWCKRSLFWVLYEYLKRESNQGDTENFFRVWDRIAELDIINIPSETVPRECLFRCVKTLNKVISQRRNMPVDNVAERLLAAIDTIQIPMPGDECTAMLDTFLPLSEVWGGFLAFAEQRLLPNIREEDFAQRETVSQNGRNNRYMSFAESAYIAYTKALIKSRNIDKMREFQPQLDQLADDNRMTFLGYFNAKLLQAINGSRDDVLREVRPFARRKRYDYWVWQFLSELFIDDEEKYLACLLRASHCQTREDFLPKIRVKLANIYYQRADFARLKYQVEKYVRFRLEHGYPIAWEVQRMMNDSRYASAVADSGDPIDFATITNRIIDVSDNAPINRHQRTQANRTQPNSSDNKQPNKHEKRNIQGKVIRAKSGTMFVKTDELMALIPEQLTDGLNANDNVLAEIKAKYNKKLNKDGWICIKITKQ